MKVSGLILGVLSLVAYSQAVPGTPNELTLPSAINHFGLALFEKLRSREGNVLFSPLGAHSVLSMAYSGSCNETAKEMRSALLLKSGRPSNSTRGYAEFLNKVKVLESAGGASVLLANRVFLDKSRKVKERFKKLLTDNFLADAVELDFKGEPFKSIQTIIEWVERQTTNRIHNVVPQGGLIPDTVILANAVFFKGKWDVKFSEKNTRPGTFRVNSNLKENVDMMSIKGDFKYAEYPEFQILSLNYKGDDTSMVVMLPKNVDGLPKLEASLPKLNWTEIEEKMKGYSEVKVTWPKFILQQTTNLEPLLKEMGMKRAFDPELAQFPRISDNHTYISNVLQKVFIEVDETGSDAEAAASDISSMASSSRNREHIPEFTADHPFLFFIWHKTSETVLFMGRYSSPT